MCCDILFALPPQAGSIMFLEEHPPYTLPDLVGRAVETVPHRDEGGGRITQGVYYVDYSYESAS